MAARDPRNSEIQADCAELSEVKRFTKIGHFENCLFFVRPFMYKNMTVTSGTVNLCPSIIESDPHLVFNNTVQPLFFMKYKCFIRLSNINQYIIQCRMFHTFDTYFTFILYKVEFIV